jgi:microcystin-dependent protein
LHSSYRNIPEPKLKETNMGEPMVGEIRMFAGSFAPAGWMLCAGQQLPISENEVLFQLIGTTYGGDGQSTFNLPDLQGRIPMHQGQGPGISQSYQLGEAAGVESVTLTTQQIPVHTHALIACSVNGTQVNPGANVIAASASSVQPYIEDSASLALSAQAITPVGGSQPHTNFQPYLCINFIISLFGIYPRPQ